MDGSELKTGLTGWKQSPNPSHLDGSKLKTRVNWVEGSPNSSNLDGSNALDSEIAQFCCQVGELQANLIKAEDEGSVPSLQ